MGVVFRLGYEQADISFSGIPGGGRVGLNVRLHQAVAVGRADGSTDFCVALHRGLRTVAGILAD